MRNCLQQEERDERKVEGKNTAGIIPENTFTRVHDIIRLVHSRVQLYSLPRLVAFAGGNRSNISISTLHMCFSVLAS